MLEEKELKKYIFIGLVILIVALSYLIIKDYIIPIVSSIILAYLFYPIYNFISKKINKNISSFIIIFFIFAIIILPLFFIIQSLIIQLSHLLTDQNINAVTETLSKFLKDNPKVQEYIPQLIEKGGSWLMSSLLSFISYIPKMIFEFFIILFITFYLLIDGKNLLLTVKNILPFKDKDKLIKNISSTTSKIVYGFGLVAIIQFIVAAIAFLIFGFKLWLFLAFLVGISAFIPLIGPAIVWVPATILFILQRNWTLAVLMIIVGVILSYVINTFLAIKIINKKARIHPVILLIGILGGVSLFGIIGLIVGPLIIGVLFHLLKATAEKS